ncbi:MAG: cytochrome c family protein [Magnetospirillum sp.]|nr:cytochrome c family protein [Magnetospirillum sp.]
MIVRIVVSLPVLALFAGTAYAQVAGDAAAGEKVFKQCQVCHTAEPGKNKIGPSLYGVVGRKSGSAEGFNYSPAMKTANIVWTPENLDKYLTDPKAMVPGNKMAFPGLKNPQDRQNVIAYLAQLPKEKK